jgi:hypothetical protein
MRGASYAKVPTFDEAFAEAWQRWKDLGHAINDVRRALGELQSIRAQIDCSAADRVEAA